MSFACDIILIAIALFTIYKGWAKGFVNSAMSLVKGFAAGLAAYAYTPVLGSLIKEKWIHGSLTDNIFQTLRAPALDLETDMFNLGRLIADRQSDLVTILDRYNIPFDEFAKKYSGMTQVTEDAVYQCAAEIAEPTSTLLSSALAFIVIFVGALIVLSLLTSLLNLVFRIPVLKTANQVLGGIFGVAEAFLLLAVFSILFSNLVTALGSVAPKLFNPDTIDNTIICKFFTEHNPLKQILSLLI